MAQISALTPLTIGDKVPDLKLSKVLDVPYSVTSLAASNDKLLLLDFWATWCASCIREFPKLDSLQNLYAGQLQVVLVNNYKSGDDQKKVTAFFDKRKTSSRSRYNLQVVFDSGRLEQLFPHKTIPHTVWIYKGKVVAISSPEEVTVSNIDALFDNKPLRVTFKSEQLDFDAHKPLLLNNNGGGVEILLSRSLFTRYIEGVWNSTGISLDMTGFKRLYLVDHSLLRMYAIAYSGIAANRFIIDSSVYRELINTTNDRDWKKQHHFCYELTMPVSISLQGMHDRMRKDLDNQFGLYSRLEKRTLDCYALVMLPSAGSSSISGMTQLGNKSAGEEYFRLEGQSLSVLVERVNEQVPATAIKPVVLDETGYSGNVNLQIKSKDLDDIPGLRRALHPFGLDIVPCKRELMVVVISKSNF
ncbi:TlpA family protein disulfide reductase [Ferruginibacter sp.]